MTSSKRLLLHAHKLQMAIASTGPRRRAAARQEVSGEADLRGLKDAKQFLDSRLLARRQVAASAKSVSADGWSSSGTMMT